MRLSHALIFAGALVVATPTLAQDNAAAPDSVAAGNAADANTGAPAVNANTASTAAVAPTETTTTDTNTSTSPAPVSPPKSFPWGVGSLVGLIGLFGVRKVKS